jgi:hypothetical protein
VGELTAVDWGVTAIGGDAKGGRGAGISEKRERGAAEAKTVEGSRGSRGFLVAMSIAA